MPDDEIEAHERGITTALDAGYVLAGHPEISVRGSVNRDWDTGIDVPMAEVSVTLHFRRAPDPA